MKTPAWWARAFLLMGLDSTQTLESSIQAAREIVMSNFCRLFTSGLEILGVTILVFLSEIVALTGMAYAGSGVTAYKVEQIAVPGATYTYAAALNKSGDVVGQFTVANGATEGFELKGKKYTTLLVPGSDNYTAAGGINDSGLIVGTFYTSSHSEYHGFLYRKGKYTQYDVELNVVSTEISAVNNNGDFGGETGAADTPTEAFVNIGGVLTQFYATGTDNTFLVAMNNSDDSVGEYYDSSGNAHGFYRSASGAITVLNFPGAVQTLCNGINDSGVISGYYYDSAGETHGFLYSGGTFTELSFLTTAGINNAGDLVGQSVSPAGVAGSYLARPATFASYATVDIPGAESSAIYGINSSKAMVGVYTNSSGATHGLLYEKDKVTNIDDPNAQAGTTVAYNINTAGDIVGAYTNGGGVEVGFYYSDGTYTDVAPSGSQYTSATGINDSGVITGGWVDSSGNGHGYTYNGSTYTSIDVPGASFTGCWGINDSGDITCQWVDQYGDFESSLYNGSTFTTIDVPVAYLTAAHSINKDGDVVFLWQDIYGNSHGAILKAGSYYIFDVPLSDGASTDADGINAAGEIVGHFTPTGTSVTSGYEGKL